MTIEEVNKVLRDKNMQNKETNFKVKDSKSGGKSKKITLEFLANQLVKTNDRVELLATQLAKTNEKLDAFYNQFLEFSKLMLDFKSKQEQFNSFVLDQFKQHGWTK